MALYLVRHGETDWNREKRFQSRTDIPLNETGLAQARAVGRLINSRGVGFSYAFCSPLGRAVRTAEIILEGTGLPLNREQLLLELEFGGFEGQLEADLRKRLGGAYEEWRASNYTMPPPLGGEDITAGAQRVRPLVDKLRELNPQGDLLVVAHQGINMAIKVAVTGKSDVESAKSYRQNNDEVDIWDLAQGQRLEQIKVVTG